MKDLAEGNVLLKSAPGVVAGRAHNVGRGVRITLIEEGFAGATRCYLEAGEAAAAAAAVS